MAKRRRCREAVCGWAVGVFAACRHGLRVSGSVVLAAPAPVLPGLTFPDPGSTGLDLAIRPPAPPTWILPSDPGSTGLDLAIRPSAPPAWILPSGPGSSGLRVSARSLFYKYREKCNQKQTLARDLSPENSADPTLRGDRQQLPALRQQSHGSEFLLRTPARNPEGEPPVGSLRENMTRKTVFFRKKT